MLAFTRKYGLSVFQCTIITVLSFMVSVSLEKLFPIWIELKVLWVILTFSWVAPGFFLAQGLDSILSLSPAGHLAASVVGNIVYYYLWVWLYNSLLKAAKKEVNPQLFRDRYVGETVLIIFISVLVFLWSIAFLNGQI